MRHTDDEIKRASRWFEQLAEELDQQTPRSTTPTTPSDCGRLRGGKRRLGMATRGRRGRPDTRQIVEPDWGCPGVSRQAVPQRFTDKAHT
jgi:hypothetical protein